MYSDEKRYKARKGKNSKSPFDNDKKKLKEIFFYEITKSQMNMKV